MGPEEIKAAGIYKNGIEGSLPFESLPYHAMMTTYSADSSVTESAASATAMATGHKVNNGVLSTAIPGDGSELTTVLEYLKGQGKSTGLVTTTYITEATPAAFGAHENSRSNLSQIASDYLNQTKPDILFGGGAHGITESDAIAAGYTVVKNRIEMEALMTNTVYPVSGQFGTSHFPFEYDYFTGSDHGYDTLPHLSEMTQTALDILQNDPDGFFLMVEGGRIDHAGHLNSIAKNIFETIEFSNAVDTVLSWASVHTDTLVIVTADHETGGLQVQGNNGQGNIPPVSWSTAGHTGINVDVYAQGPNSYMVNGIIDNTDIFSIMMAGTPTYISLSYFKVKQKGNKVVIVWKTASEIDTIGFNIFREDTATNSYRKINKKLIQAKGTAQSGYRYRFVDKRIKGRHTYLYQLEDIDKNLTSTFHDAEKIKIKGRLLRHKAKKHKKRHH